MPIVIAKGLSKFWRPVILWPRHESDRLRNDRVNSFYTYYVPKDTGV
uniref:Uncharacterized protein n=1 Tax=Tetranychus urticae TaxID=32264 RepID=T1JVA5_TETUR